MAPKSLLLSPSSFVPLFPFANKTLTLTLTLISPKKASTISCRSSNSPSTFTEPEGTGTGAAAPTRGDLFLDCHNAKSSAKVILKEKKRTKAKVSTSVVCSYGCGAHLQTVELDAPGYVDSETYELKKRHHQLRTILCGRCKLLSNGRMVTAVGGHGGYSGGKLFISAEELREKQSHLRHEKVLIVKLFSGTST